MSIWTDEVISGLELGDMTTDDAHDLIGALDVWIKHRAERVRRIVVEIDVDGTATDAELLDSLPDSLGAALSWLDIEPGAYNFPNHGDVTVWLSRDQYLFDALNGDADD